MFIYLSKKIAIPNGINLHSLSWNPDQGWITCGGDSGLLKVLKLDQTTGQSKKDPKAAAASNLSMNQTLDGHHGKVVCVTWNPVYRKLTTSDETGLIIVWMLHKGMWFEEMINNRNKSVVRDMKWTADGSKICIVYEDGAVIVGSVDGNRMWGKELDFQLSLVEWSPDSQYILFVSPDCKIHAFDSQGNKVKRLTLPVLEHPQCKEKCTVAAINWYDGAEGHSEADGPTLAVALSNGLVQVSRGVDDRAPLIIDSKLNPLTQCKWDSRGAVLAVAGMRAPDGPSMVHFYDAQGSFLRALKVPGGAVSALSWEGGGLRIALAVEAFIFFANIRPDYKWGYLGGAGAGDGGGGTVVYAFTKPERRDSTVLFWDLDTDERCTVNVPSLRHLKAAGDNCLLVSGPDGAGAYSVSLCSAIGSPVETKLLPAGLRPLFAAMTPLHVVVADERFVYVWQYRTPVLKLIESEAGGLRRAGRERVVDVLAAADPAQPVEEFSYPSDKGRGGDKVCALAASEKALVVALESGAVLHYSLPHVTLELTSGALKGGPKAALMKLNCDSSLVGLIDSNGQLAILQASTGALLPGLERKDVWDLCWAADSARSFAVMEKTRMFVFEDLVAQEPKASSGFLAHMGALSVRAVLLDDIMTAPDRPTRDTVVDFDTDRLRVCRELVEAKGCAEALAHAEASPHPRLFKVVAEAALAALDLGVADKALVRCGDYRGIQLVKRLHGMGDQKLKARAEVAAHYGRFDEAEAIFKDLDRKDLAIDLRVRTGEWFKAVALIQTGGGDDKQLRQAMTMIGEWYCERRQWDKAVHYFSQAKQQGRMAECHYRLGDFAALSRMVTLVPVGAVNEDGQSLLLDLAGKFEGVGMHEEAVECYLKAGQPKAAMECAVLLNQWSRAVQLAQEFDFPQMEGLLAKKALALKAKDRLAAVELYRKANKSTDAARLLAAIAEEVEEPMRAKKLQVLAALEVERFKRSVSAGMTGEDIAQATAKTLDTLMTMDASEGAGSTKVLDNAWRGAAAYHYFLLAQRQLYSGSIDDAMKTSIRLAEYEDILPQRAIFSLIALTAYHNGFFGVCSRAFVKLETLPTVDQEQVQSLALQIFTKHSPLDPAPLPAPYLECLDKGTPYSACTASGRWVEAGDQTLVCRTCRYPCLERAIQSKVNCPLCHAPLDAGFNSRVS